MSFCYFHRDWVPLDWNRQGTYALTLWGRVDEIVENYFVYKLVYARLCTKMKLVK